MFLYVIDIRTIVLCTQHSLSITAYPSQGLEPIPVDIGPAPGYTIDKLSVTGLTYRTNNHSCGKPYQSELLLRGS